MGMRRKVDTNSQHGGGGAMLSVPHSLRFFRMHGAMEYLEKLYRHACTE